MEIRENRISWYIEQMDNPYSFARYGDSELFCMAGEREGTRSGFGQLHTVKVKDQLLNPLRRRKKRFFPGFPKCALSLPAAPIIQGMIDMEIPWVTWYEQDMVTDELAERAGLYPFIKKLQSMDVYIVGPWPLRGLDFLNYKKFFQIPEQDFHLSKELDEVEDAILKHNKKGIYLFSGGIGATILIGRLHGKLDAVLFDCGSIWDAFVGIGGQREWREKLYKNQDLLLDWKKRNIYGKSD